MYVLYEDGGKFLAGRVLSEADASLQIELDSGKRVKLKSALALLRFESPAPSALLHEAARHAASIELDLAWEFAPDAEFGFAEVAAEYFGGKPTAAQEAGALMRLFEAPHYFRRAGRGRFKKAPAEVLQQALAAIEKKARVQAQIDEWATQLAAGTCPDAVREQLYRILFKPDKNAPEYKAVAQAARASQLDALALLLKAGAIGSPYQFHWQRFAFEHFPKGPGFPPNLPAPALPADLPLASVQAFSIDDSETTEIDDALSVQGLGTDTITVGVHIAAPGLAIAPGSALDDVARNRLSTVYMPGHKITMLPDSVVQHYTLQEGRDCPALSLYVSFDAATLNVQSHRTAIERVPIAANLRHDRLEHIVTDSWLIASQDNPAPADDETALLRSVGGRNVLSFLYRFAKTLKGRREVVRGKPEGFNRPDFTFRVASTGDTGPSGDEPVQISTRMRGGPLDLIVAECMILANNTWGGWLAELGVPGIYRSQHSTQPGIKVRMGTRALPHAGMGVAHYAWSTSPLRRYVDLVNQWQLLACARHGSTAALVAPFKPKDAALMAVISSFEAAYAAYAAHQSAMERYWSLRFIEQRGITELDASVLRDGLVRAESLPLVLLVLGAVDLPRGTRVRVKLGRMDLITLDVGGTVVARLADDATTTALPEDEDDDTPAAGPIAIAVDLDAGADAANPVAADSGAAG